MQKTIQKECRKNKVIKRNGDKLYVKWKGCDNFLIVRLIKKTLYKMIQYFPRSYEPFGGDTNVNGDLSNYTRKKNKKRTDLKKVAVVDTSNLAAKFDLASLKAKIDKIDVDKLNSVSVVLSKLSNVVNNEVVKKTVW